MKVKKVTKVKITRFGFIGNTRIIAEGETPETRPCTCGSGVPWHKCEGGAYCG